MHDVLMRNVAIGKENLIDRMLSNQLRQLRFRLDGNTLRILRPG